MLRGELRPGQRLIEEQLAESLGASRTPVRQAIHMLQREGLAERAGRGGFVVRALSLKDAEEILDMRAILESSAARRAAERSLPTDIDELEKLNNAFGRAIHKATSPG